MYVEDICQVIRLLLNTGGGYGIYHLGGPERLSRYDIGNIFAERFFGTTEGIIESRLEREGNLGDIDDTSLITTKAREETGHVFTGFRDGIESLKPAGTPQYIAH